MVNPIHLQDNLSKAPLASQFQDQENEGAQHMRDVHRNVAMKELERQQKNVAQGMEEKAESKGVTPDGHREKKESAGKEGRKRDSHIDKEQQEAENDLRFRRPEDDLGKGGSLDLNG